MDVKKGKTNHYHTIRWSMLNNDHLLQNEARLRIATKTNDIIELDRLLHEELLFTDQHGRLITKPIVLEVSRSGNLMIDLLSVKEHKINLIRGVAVVSSLIYLMGGRYTDEACAGTFRYNRVWKNDGGTWQLITGSCVQVI